MKNYSYKKTTSINKKIAGFYDADDGIDLFLGAEIACVDRVKVNVLGFPVVSDRRQLIGQILAGEIFEHCMCRQDSCRKDDRLNAHGGDDRKSDRQGAFSQT